MGNDLAPTAYGLSRDVDLSPLRERLFAALPEVVFCHQIVDIALSSGHADQSSFTCQFHTAASRPPAACLTLHRESGK